MKHKSLLLIIFTVVMVAWCRAAADHAVLVSAEGPIPYAVGMFFTQPGERVAVKAVDVWVIRASQATLAAIKTSGLPVIVIDTEVAAAEFVEDKPSYSWLIHLFAKPDYDPAVDELRIIEKTAPAEVPDDKELKIRPLMKRSGVSDVDYHRTSDIMIGSTVVAVFYLNHQLPGVSNWNPELAAQAHANILLNLAWWTDQVNAYGHPKTFIVRSFWPDDPVNAIDFDPTDGAQVNFSANDSRIANAIMDNLGYMADAHHTARMRTYCNDLRAEESTDWAYMAFLLTGAYSVRAHASFGGPSTVLMASQAANGFVFAHETGHIFNAFDEYFEEGRSLFRSRQSRFGIPNGNHRFRNHPVMPSMMSGSFRGLSGYTAAHLGLIDTLRLFRVEVSPPSATYEVGYIPMDGSEADAVFFSRYQGDLDFAWGNGMRVVLRGLPEISHEGKRYKNASWQGGAKEVVLHINDTTPERVSLSYTSDGTSGNISMEYLTVGNALASELVRDIKVTGNREAFFSGEKGISLWADGDMAILDFPLRTSRGGQGRDTVYRICHSIAACSKGSYHFSSQNGEVLSWSLDGLNNDKLGHDRNLRYYTVAATSNGEVYATDGGIVGGREMRGSGLHRFVNSQVMGYTTANSALPGNSISAIANGPRNTVWIGYAGTEQEPKGLFLFDPIANTISDHTQQLTYPLIVRLSRLEDESLLVVSRNAHPGANITVQSAVDLVKPDTVISFPAVLFDPIGRINDAALLPDGRLVVATNKGVGIQLVAQEKLEHYHRGNSELISDMCFSISTAPNGNVFVGTADGAVIISGVYEGIASTGPKVTITPDNIHLDQNYPNPFSLSTTISWQSEKSGYTTIDIYDIMGRKIKTLVNAYYQPGTYKLIFEAGTLDSGVYYYQLQVGNNRKIKKMMIMK